jgi:hypothetical protein
MALDRRSSSDNGTGRKPRVKLQCQWIQTMAMYLSRCESQECKRHCISDKMYGREGEGRNVGSEHENIK